MEQFNVKIMVLILATLYFKIGTPVPLQVSLNQFCPVPIRTTSTIFKNCCSLEDRSTNRGPRICYHDVIKALISCDTHCFRDWDAGAYGRIVSAAGADERCHLRRFVRWLKQLLSSWHLFEVAVAFYSLWMSYFLYHLVI